MDRITSFGNDPGGYNNSPVNSYVTNDASTGGQMVLNVTLPGHPLFPGVVARYPSLSETGIMINNVGEGANWKQAYNPLASLIKNVWQGQTQGIVDNLSRAGQNLINFNSLPSIGRAK